jgi:hypothetical protein
MLKSVERLRYRLDGRGAGARFPTEARDFSALGPTQPPIQWTPRAASPVVKWSGREADHSPPSSAETKIGGATPPLPHTPN